MFGSQNYTSASWLEPSLIRLLSIHYLAVDMDNYDAIQVRTIPPTPAPRSHTTLQRPCTNHYLRLPPTCPPPFSHKLRSFFSSLHSRSHSTFQRPFTYIRFQYAGNSCIVLTAFQKTEFLFGKAQLRPLRASSAVSAWLPFFVV